jgi:hypothetical protein
MKLKCTILIAVAAFTLSNCSKQDENNSRSISSVKDSNEKPISIPPPGKSKVPNYCAGCGNSSDKDDRCIPVYLGEGPGGMDMFCGKDLTYLLCTGMAINNYSNIQNSGLTVNLENMYEIRDSFFIRYSIGQKYITNYYAFSKILQENGGITNSNFMQHYNLGIHLVSAINLLMTGSSTSIPFNNTLKAEALAMVNYYRSLCSNPEFVAMCNDIETDLNLFTNKTNLEIWTLIDM